jgi:hypothetical protein
VAVHRYTAGDLCDAVEAYTGIDDAGAALVHVQAGLGWVLEGLDPAALARGLATPHRWSWLRPEATLALSATTSGTATGVYDAGADTTTVTATTSIFHPNHAGDTLTVADVGDLVIASWTSDTVVVATGGENFAGKAVSLPASGVYALPSGFGGFVGRPVYTCEATGYQRPRLEEVSPEQIYTMWAASHETATPRWYALAPVQGAAGAATWTVLVAPRSEYDRLWHYRYELVLDALADDAEDMPGPAYMDPVYRAAALADAEQVVGHASGYWVGERDRALVAAIAKDGRARTEAPPSHADAYAGP